MSIVQVHKAKLRSFCKAQVAAAQQGAAAKQRASFHTLRAGETAWAVCNLQGIGMGELQRLNKGVALGRVSEGQRLSVPLRDENEDQGVGGSGRTGKAGGTAQRSLIRASAAGETPRDGLVAVKVGNSAERWEFKRRYATVQDVYWR